MERQSVENPPYGLEVVKWFDKLSIHGNGIALIFARTETKMFLTRFNKADALLFIEGRPLFHHVDGKKLELRRCALQQPIAYGKEKM